MKSIGFTDNFIMISDKYAAIKVLKQKNWRI